MSYPTIHPMTIKISNSKESTLSSYWNRGVNLGLEWAPFTHHGNFTVPKGFKHQDLHKQRLDSPKLRQKANSLSMRLGDLLYGSVMRNYVASSSQVPFNPFYYWIISWKDRIIQPHINSVFVWYASGLSLIMGLNWWRATSSMSGLCNAKHILLASCLM